MLKFFLTQSKVIIAFLNFRIQKLKVLKRVKNQRFLKTDAFFFTL